jgi:hypothetical protein
VVRRPCVGNMSMMEQSPWEADSRRLLWKPVVSCCVHKNLPLFLIRGRWFPKTTAFWDIAPYSLVSTRWSTSARLHGVDLLRPNYTALVYFDQTTRRWSTSTRLHGVGLLQPDYTALVYFSETTRRYMPEGCHLYACHHDNLKSHTHEFCP